MQIPASSSQIERLSKLGVTTYPKSSIAAAALIKALEAVEEEE